MKIQNISIKDFKRFKDLKISGLPESARLIVLIGPNGCGKSSLFDAINGWVRTRTRGIHFSLGAYYDRIVERSDPGVAINGVNVFFHNEQPSNQIAWRKAVYARSAYRNDPSFSIDQLHKMGSVLQEDRFLRMIDNDQETRGNYMRLVSQALEDVFERQHGNKSLEHFREEILTEIRGSIQILLPGLVLNSLGNPLSGSSTFRFNKGDTKGFAYENLSGGEKAAFDLILDLVVKRREYDDTVFCIDEPEAHMNMRVQRELLNALYQLIPGNSQLWIATHSIGMMREAQNLHRNSPGEVVFLDFDGLDFDIPQEIKPAEVNRSLWERMHSVVLDDLADLVFPSVLYICESTPEVSFDADCYNTIFSSEHPDVKFVSVGSKKDAKLCAMALRGAIPKQQIIALRDRDNMTEEEIEEEQKEGTRILSRTCIESYLLDDDVLAAFCEKAELSPEELASLKRIRDANLENPKRAAQDIRTHILQTDKSLQIGDNWQTFLKYSLTPLIIPSMQIYKELSRDIFRGESG